ncbi:DUF2075 domain-containing protein [Flavobacteriaceae bacterium]|nr:DUF2075 domain-containing protein [Flavobacteriaceae bacterium]
MDNSDLFKYSPYKSLTKDQSQGLLQILQSLATGKYDNTIVEGGAGTGKTILAIFLFKMLSSQLEDFSFKAFGTEENVYIDLVNQIKKVIPSPKMALVVPMSSFRTTLKKVFKNIKGLSASMVIGPAQVSKEKYDLLVVDESHRLRRRVNLGAYFGAFDKACQALNLDKHKASELDWVTMQSKHTVLFYDEGQSIKPSDTKKEEFDIMKSSKDTSILKLKSQFRVKGGNEYVEYIDSLLNNKLKEDSSIFYSKEYEFTMFDSIETMIQQIKLRDQESGLSRLIAGYSWEWKSNKNKDTFDIHIDDVKLKWNGTSNDWINSDGAINEVGCIHTTQGYDLNYSGIIFGNEISFNPVTKEIIVNEENYFDKNGKQSIKDPKELKLFILNIYKTIMLRGIKGTYIYVCDPLLRDYFESFIPKYTYDQVEVKKIFKTENIKPFENSIPLYNLKVAAGAFGELQQVEDVEWLSIPKRIKPSKDLFACQVVGESMNKIIPNGAFCLFRKYKGGSRNGQIVLVENTNMYDSDFGSCYTVKQYDSKKQEDENGWKHQSIILKPLSTESRYENILLENGDLSTFRVIGIFECLLE